MNRRLKEYYFRQTVQSLTRDDVRVPQYHKMDPPQPRPIPPSRAAAASQEPLPPFSALTEVACQDCGGMGYDPCGVNFREPDDCPSCHGSGKETILRNYLAEAFRIAADPEIKLELERAHLVALTAYARQTVSALMSLQELA